MKLMISNPRSGLRIAFDARSINHAIKTVGLAGSEEMAVSIVKVEKLQGVTKLSFRIHKRGVAVGSAPAANVSSSPRSPDFSWAATWAPSRTPHIALPLFGHVILTDSDFSLTKAEMVCHLPEVSHLPPPVSRAHGDHEEVQVVKSQLVEVVMLNPDGHQHKFRIPAAEALSVATKWGAEGRAVIHKG